MYSSHNNGENKRNFIHTFVTIRNANLGVSPANNIDRLDSYFQTHPRTLATTLTHKLLREIATFAPEVQTDGTTEPFFYKTFVSNYASFFESKFNIDPEIFPVICRQAMILLKDSGIISQVDNYLKVETEKLHSIIDFNHYLFLIFWNKTKWSSLFPSMPSVALFLHSTRHIIAELLCQKQKPFFVDSIAIDYLIASNYRYRNELLFTSFFDFSIISWMAFFGLCEYSTAPGKERVQLTLTEKGRGSLSVLF